MNVKQRKSCMIAISIINAILILLCCAGCIYVATSGNGLYYVITSITEFIALIFSILYFTLGYKKDAAKFYKLFFLFYALTYLVECFAGVIGFDDLGVTSKTDITIIVSMFLYGNTLLLAVAKDLGKKWAYALSLINVFLYLLPLLGLLIPNLVVYDTVSLKASGIILFATWFVLALNAFIMTIAKYKDKELRGTK